MKIFVRTVALVLASSSLLAGAARAQGGDMPTMAGMGRMVRGTVTATAADHLTIRTEAGEVYQIAINPNTRLAKERQPVKLADVHVGDGVGAAGEIDQPTRTVHALFVGVVSAEQVRKARESLGKTWIAGKITAIDETRITVMRSDNVLQTITVDEDTSFKKGGRGMQAMMGGGPVALSPQQGPGGGESITLADVKVGDTVAGNGALKDGVFVPTQLMVGDPSAGGGRRRRQAGDAAPAAPQGPR